MICYTIWLACPVDAKAQAEVVGKLSVVKGSVTIERPGFGKVLTVRSGAELLVGDVLTTGTDNGAQLVLRDFAYINIAPDASLRVNQYVFTPETLRRKIFVNLIRGKARFVVKRNMSQDSAIIVETESARVIAPGQVDFVMNASPEATEVLMLFGYLMARNLSDFIVGEMSLSENLTTIVKPMKPPSQPVVMKAKQRNEYIREVR